MTQISSQFQSSNKQLIQSLIKTVHQNVLHDIFNRSLIINQKSTPIHQLSSPAQQSNSRLASSTKKVKSEFSEEQKRKIGELKLQMEAFEKSLQQKTQQLKLQQLKIRQFEKLKQNSELKELWKKHRIQALKRKQKRWKTQQMEQMIIQQHKQKQKSLSLKKRLYKELQIDFKKQQQQQKKAKDLIIVKISQQKRELVDIKTLSQHERSYLNYLKENKKQRARKLQQIKETSNSIAMKEQRFKLKSRFYDKITEEIVTQKKQAQQIESQKQERRRRVKVFLQDLRSKSYFSLSKKSSNQRNSVSPEQIPKRNKQLSYTELYKLGNQFMKQSLLKISKTSNSNRESHQRKMDTKKTDQLKNIDYLGMMRERRLKMGHEHQSTNILSINDMKIKKILDSNISHQQKLQQLKKMAYKLEASTRSDQPYLQIQKIQAKLKILNATMIEHT